MIDADKLDEIERAFATADKPMSPDAVLYLRATAGRELLATARQAIAYLALIEAHNAGREDACRIRRERVTPASCLMSRSTVKGRCSDCPRLDMIGVAGVDEGQAKEPGAC